MVGLSRPCVRIFDSLVDGMEPGTSRQVGEKGGGYMPLYVERLTETHYSLAHYFEQNGDLMSDPDMEFWRSPKLGDVVPVNITQHPVSSYKQAVFFTADENEVEKYSPRLCRELAQFAAMWLKNVKSQQPDFFKLTRAQKLARDKARTGTLRIGA